MKFSETEVCLTSMYLKSKWHSEIKFQSWYLKITPCLIISSFVDYGSNTCESLTFTFALFSNWLTKSSRIHTYICNQVCVYIYKIKRVKLRQVFAKQTFTSAIRIRARKPEADFTGSGRREKKIGNPELPLTHSAIDFPLENFLNSNNSVELLGQINYPL